MLTSFILGAICAVGIGASAEAVQADTLDRYVINGLKVEKFDGSQLVGKNISDYKVVVADGEVEGKVFRMHLIRTDGQKVEEIKFAKTVEVSSSTVYISSSTVYIIDGKKGSYDSLKKIKPESIASMTVYKPGSKEAVEISGKQDISVVKVETKK